jgi:hypothetical protein
VIAYEDFAARLGFIGLKLRQAIGDPTALAYFEDFMNETDREEWEAFTRVATRQFGWKWVPTATELHDALREWRGEPALDVEAAKAYEATVQSGLYDAEYGTKWSYRRVLDLVGKAAADAFLAAGGHHAFATTFKESDRRERFVASYVSDARANPAARALPAGEEPRQLEGGEEPPKMSAEEAREAMRRIAGFTKVEGPQPMRLTAEERQARLDRLREQAEALRVAVTWETTEV